MNSIKQVLWCTWLVTRDGAISFWKTLPIIIGMVVSILGILGGYFILTYLASVLTSFLEHIIPDISSTEALALAWEVILIHIALIAHFIIAISNRCKLESQNETSY